MASDDSNATRRPPGGTGPWYEDGLRFECTCCGNCCTGGEGAVWFDDDEGRAMASHLGLDYPEFLVRHTRVIDGHRSLNEIDTEHGYDCVFLDRETVPGKAICGLYEVRPVQCRTWPFWPEVLRDERAWNRMKKNTPCPGMGEGQLFTVESIVERLVEQRDSESKPW